MNGKICLVTGASAGIGYQTAFRLARMGAKTIIASKNEQNGRVARDKIIGETGNEQVEFIQVDLSSQASIRKFANHFESKYPLLDVLVNNAGVYYSKLTFTEDDIEMQFAINHLAPFMLSLLLLKTLKNADRARIVNVTSRFHFQGRLHFDDLFLKKRYNGLVAYCQSKLAMVHFTYKLADLLSGSGITVNCLHPGTARTNIGNTNATGLYPLVCNIAKPLLTTAGRASRTSVFLASSEKVDGTTGKYFQSRKAVRSSRRSYIKQDTERLWKITEDMTGIRFNGAMSG